MLRFRNMVVVLMLLAQIGSAYGQSNLAKDGVKVSVDNNGFVKSFTYPGERGETDLLFRDDDYLKGPALFFNEKRLDVSKIQSKEGQLTFNGENDTLKYSLNYEIEDGAFVVKASITNKLSSTIENPIVTLKPGVNTELDSFPQWNDIFFPTLLRCETTHMWGYISNGAGDVIAMGTKEPVASWQMEYFDPSHWRGKGGHLIYSYRIDLMHKLPLPVRHPQNLTKLKGHETKSWTYYLKPVKDIQDVKPTLAKVLASPMIEAERYTVALGETVKLDISAATSISATLTTPSGKVKKIKLAKKGNGLSKAQFDLKDGIGVYSFKVKASNGQVSEAALSTRQNYSWYMDKARDASLRYGQ